LRNICAIGEHDKIAELDGYTLLAATGDAAEADEMVDAV
jgi:20S proteasome alpha/beta subunit